MRQPDPTTVCIDCRALRTLVESVPDNRLRDFALDLLLANTNAPAPAGRIRRSPPKRSAATKKRRLAQKRRRAREASERRAARKANANGTAPASAAAPRKPGRPKGSLGSGDKAARLKAQRARDAVIKRERRAEARAAVAEERRAEVKINNGNGAAAAAPVPREPPVRGPTAQALWSKARELNSLAPYKVVVEEFGVNRAQAVDCQRNCSVPPGINSAAVARFLALPATEVVG